MYNKGSIYFDKQRNKYRAMQIAPDGHRITKRFATRDEAEAWLAGTRADIYKGQYIAVSDMTVGEWVLSYLELFVMPNVRIKTYMDYLNIVRHMEKIFPYNMQKITAIDIQRWLHKLDASASMKHRVKAMLKRAFEKAYALGHIKKNIMLDIDTPKVVKKPIEIFTVEEIAKIIATMEESSWARKHLPFVLTAITTGCRLGELCAITADDIQANAITIHQTISEVKGKVIIQPPKSNAGFRRITVPEWLIAYLKGLVVVSTKTDGFVFHNKAGGLIRVTNFDKTWKLILRDANVPYRKFHCLRHTHATQLLAAGVPILEVSKRLGHSRPSHTLNLYGHAIPGFDENIPKKVDNIFKLYPSAPSNAPTLAPNLHPKHSLHALLGK